MANTWTVKTDWSTGKHTSTLTVRPHNVWVRPAPPGILPKRPLGFVEVMDCGFRILRASPALTFGFTGIVIGLLTLFMAAVGSALVFLGHSQLVQLLNADDDAIAGLVLASQVGATALSIIVIPLMQFFAGTGALATRRGFDGEKLGLKEGWRELKGVRWKLIVSSLALITVLLAITAIAFAPAVALLVLSSPVGGLVLAVLGAFLWAGACAVILVKTMFVGAVLAVERPTLMGAFRRSAQLTKGSFWKTLGQSALGFYISAQLVQLLITPAAYIIFFGTLIALLLLGGDNAEFSDTYISIFAAVLGVFLAIAATSLLFAYWGNLGAAMYFDRRIRTEGYDLEMLRLTEERMRTAPTLGLSS